MNLEDVAPTIHQKLLQNPKLIILIKSDENTRYGVVSDVIEELRRAQALRIAFSAKPEEAG